MGFVLMQLLAQRTPGNNVDFQIQGFEVPKESPIFQCSRKDAKKDSVLPNINECIHNPKKAKAIPLWVATHRLEPLLQTN